MTVPTLSFVDRVIFNAQNDGTASFVEAGAVKGYQTMEAAGAVNGSPYGYAAQSHDLTSWEVGYGTWTTATKTLTRTVLFNSAGTSVPVGFDQQPQVMITALAESLPGPVGPQGPPGSQADPLFLTQGLSVNATNPTVFGNTTYRRPVDFTATYNQLITDPGFTDQVALGIQLNFNAGLNIYNSVAPATVLAKYTPIALNVGADFPGAGEKFVASFAGNFWSMGDSFAFSSNSVYAGGPIAGDEGQGYSPAMAFTQPNGINYEHVTAVVRTTYTATITSPVTASQNAQNIAVSTTTGANVGDWVIINQAAPSNNSAIWAMQVLAINPGVSINGVLPMNCAIGTTITPALCLNLDGGGFQFGEGRVLVNYSGASYSTGTINTITGGAVFGQGGASWSNTMVGGNANNIGAIYFDVDSLTTAIFLPASPCRSVYQITTIASSTELGLFSNSVAADVSYRGRGLPPATGFTYNIIPAARVLLINPVGSPSYTVICETSTHTWTIGDTVECTFCPYPDVHGWDFRVGEWTAGGIRRNVIFLSNPGARMFDAGIEFSGQPTYIGDITNLQVDGFSFDNGVKIASSKNPIVIFGATSSDATTYLGGPAITLNNFFGDGSDTAIQWSTGGLLTPVIPNHGFDFNMTNSAIIRSVGPSVNPDGNLPQISIQGYLQLCAISSNQPYLRIGGFNTAGASATGTFDLLLTTDGATAGNTLQFFGNQAGPTVVPLFGVTTGGSNWLAGANVPAAATATAGVNQPSQVMQLTASVWNGSAAERKVCQAVAVPDSLSSTNSTISLQFRVWDQVHDNPLEMNVPLAASSLGVITFGPFNTFFGNDTRVSLDPSNLTAPRTVKFPDTAGDVLVASTNTTGGGTALLGTNSPAVTNTAPYTWLTMISHDGSTVYVPAWK